MSRSLAQIEEEVRELSAADRRELLRVLIEDLDGPADAGVESAWREEVERRNAEIDAGTEVCIPADQVFSEIDALLKK